MANPLFQALGSGRTPQTPQMNGMFGNFQNLMQKYQQFRQTFQGDPKAEVEKMLQNGKINQQQLNMVQGLAQQFGQFLQ